MKITIKKGNHYPSVWTLIKIFFFLIFGRKKVYVRFDRSCLGYYEPEDYKGAWNKATGRCRGWTLNPRKNSIRMGWRKSATSKAIEYCMFIEQNKVFHAEIIGEAVPGEWVEWNLPRNFGFPCFPYFGGRYPAPNTITFEISNGRSL